MKFKCPRCGSDIKISKNHAKCKKCGRFSRDFLDSFGEDALTEEELEAIFDSFYREFPEFRKSNPFL